MDLDFMKNGFGLAKDKVLDIGDAIGKGFIDKILDGIENTVGKLFGKLQELRDKVEEAKNQAFGEPIWIWEK
jgi:hypothetical protein